MNSDRFKFRAWYPASDRQNAEMNYHQLDVGELWIPKSEGDPIVFMMCTGLKDKNGNLIYEGDIVSAIEWMDWRCTNFEVKFGVGHFDNGVGHFDSGVYQFLGFYLSDGTGEGGMEDTAMLPELEDMEIIGNVYENPELLQNDAAIEAK